MNLSIASGRWVSSAASKIWEYVGAPKATLAPVTPVWTQLSWQVVHKVQECLQLLASGRGALNLDDAFIGQSSV
jgi:hypothetical protein